MSPDYQATLVVKALSFSGFNQTFSNVTPVARVTGHPLAGSGISGSDVGVVPRHTPHGARAGWPPCDCAQGRLAAVPLLRRDILDAAVLMNRVIPICEGMHRICAELSLARHLS